MKKNLVVVETKKNQTQKTIFDERRKIEIKRLQVFCLSIVQK